MSRELSCEETPREMILDRRVVPSPYRVLESVPAGWLPEPGTAVPLADWLRLDDLGVAGGLGVFLCGDDDPAALEGRLDRVAFVALCFPVFADGRGYSHARRLRALWGYRGDLVAVGDVLRDQLLYMERCGVNGFLLRPDQDPRECLAAFRLYTTYYQYDPA